MSKKNDFFSIYRNYLCYFYIWHQKSCANFSSVDFVLRKCKNLILFCSLILILYEKCIFMNIDKAMYFKLFLFLRNNKYKFLKSYIFSWCQLWNILWTLYRIFLKHISLCFWVGYVRWKIFRLLLSDFALCCIYAV